MISRQNGLKFAAAAAAAGAQKMIVIVFVFVHCVLLHTLLVFTRFVRRYKISVKSESAGLREKPVMYCAVCGATPRLHVEVHVSCGTNHTVVVCANGAVWTCGRGESARQVKGFGFHVQIFV